MSHPTTDTLGVSFDPITGTLCIELLAYSLMQILLFGLQAKFYFTLMHKKSHLLSLSCPYMSQDPVEFSMSCCRAAER